MARRMGIWGAAKRGEGYQLARESNVVWFIVFVGAIFHFIFRWFSGRPLMGDDSRKTDATFLRRGTEPLDKKARPPTFWSFLPEAQRALIRNLILAALISGVWGYFTHPGGLKIAGYSLSAILAVWGLIKAYRHWKDRRFRRIYRNPLAKAASEVLSIPPHYPTKKWIEFSPAMKARLPHLEARVMGEREAAVRLWYGTHIAPVVMFVPERAMRGWWWLTGHLPTVTRAWKHGRPESD